MNMVNKNKTYFGALDVIEKNFMWFKIFKHSQQFKPNFGILLGNNCLIKNVRGR